MKNFVSTVCLSAALALSAFADSPVFVSKTGSGTTSAEVIFPADPTTAPRIVACFGTSDKAGSVFKYRYGSTAFSVTGSANNTNIWVSNTNGLVLSGTVVIQTAAGVCTSATIHSVAGGSTNLWITATNSTTAAAGDQVYLMPSASEASIKCGATTVQMNGEAIFVGARGRPLRIVLDGTSAVTLDTVSAKYD